MTSSLSSSLSQASQWLTAVPKPDDAVDLAWAMDRAFTDQDACTFLLDTDPSIETLFATLRNSLAWLRFLSARHPVRKFRPFYAAAVASGEAKLHELETRYATQQRRN